MPWASVHGSSLQQGGVAVELEGGLGDAAAAARMLLREAGRCCDPAGARGRVADVVMRAMPTAGPP